MSVTSLRKQRDRFVAFAFAAADLLLEVGADGCIAYATGALNLLDLAGEAEPVGQPLVALFAQEDHKLVETALDNLASEDRLAPIVVRLRGIDGKSVAAILRGHRLEGLDAFCSLTLTLATAADTQSGLRRRRDAESGLLDSHSFEEAAVETLATARQLGDDLRLTLLDLGGLGRFVESGNNDRISDFFETMGAILRTHSLGGDTAGRLGETKLAFVHSADVDASAVSGSIETKAREIDHSGQSVSVSCNTVDLAANGLTPAEAARAIAFTIQSYTNAAGAFEIRTLTDACRTLFAQTAADTQIFKGILRDGLIDMAFQPIVDLDSRTTRYFEALARFGDGAPPYKWVTFAETMGMAPDLDMLIYRKVRESLDDGGPADGHCLSMNLSGQSLDSDRFVETLLAELGANRHLADRLMIEITESAKIDRLQRVNAAIQDIRELGFRIGLDDFGAGAASFQYLHALDVDFVKIDGAYVQRILASQKDHLMLKAIAGLCRDLGVSTIAEMIETEDQAAKVRKLGIGYGQGYLFGRPTDLPDAPTAAPAPRRRQPANYAWSREGGWATQLSE